MTAISAKQLVRLQVLYAQFEKKALDLDRTRLCRLTWAGEQLGRRVDSFKSLTRREARTLIDRLQGGLGIAPTRRRPTSRRLSRRDGEKMGTEGRGDQLHAETTLASAEDLARIQAVVEELGWDGGVSGARFDAFLRSPRSPLAKTINRVRVAPTAPEIRTLGEANKVYWALKRIAKSEGKWKTA